jgi:hypothetical protein
MKLKISGSPVRLRSRRERTQLPTFYDCMIEHRRRRRIFDRHQSDETCGECDRIAARDSAVPVPLISDMDPMEERWTTLFSASR